MMNQEVKKQWVAALRSGEYQQAKDVLRTRDGGFCCLGVLCDIHAKATGNTWSEANAYTEATYFDAETEPPETVNEWADISVYQRVEINKTFEMLAVHNDKGATFLEIADAIEAQL